MSKLPASKLAVKGTKGPPRSPFRSRDQKSSDLEEKRLAVLRTAAELFVTQGFHSTKLTDVADRLSITKPALYYYFTGKDEILVACTRMALDATERYFAEVDDPKQTGRVRLERFMIWFGASMTEPFGKCLVRVAEHDVSGETHRQLVASKRVIYKRLRELVEAGIEDGSLAKCDAKVAAFTIAGALGWLSHWHRASGKWSAQEAATKVVELLTQGLAPGRR